MATQTKSVPDAPVEATPGARAWSEALDDPRFHDLPYKIETNARGQLLLTFHKVYHSNLQGALILLLASERGPVEEGRAVPELAVYTSEGVKVPDVAWISAARAAQIPEDAEASPVMPELCIEVLSRSNTQAEMNEKRHLFFEGGAQEVWIVDAEGAVTFYDAEGARDQSALAPGFPKKIER
jgi:Uma2 family endonuclease